MAHGAMRPRGTLIATRIQLRGPGLRWKMANTLRWGFIRGYIAAHWVAPIANRWGVTTAVGELRAILVKGSGEKVNYGVLGYRSITTAGVTLMVDDWDVNTASATNDITTFRYHGCGTGVVAENVTDTALGTESTTALVPDSTRATGTQSQPTATSLLSVGTLTFDANAAITEHGLFSQAATGGGTLWDRTVFSAINVVGASGDSIQFSYTVTISTGG